jgi:hypothetical protein
MLKKGPDRPLRAAKSAALSSLVCLPGQWSSSFGEAIV